VKISYTWLGFRGMIGRVDGGKVAGLNAEEYVVGSGVELSIGKLSSSQICTCIMMSSVMIVEADGDDAEKLLGEPESCI
jgi:hypothetical protein